MHFLTLALTALTATFTTTLAAASSSADLGIEVTHPVECSRKTQSGDTVHMHYRGTLAADGAEFDASYKRGQPLVFKLGAGRVIKGWDQGLLDMCIGEKRTLTIPRSTGMGVVAWARSPAGRR